MRKAELREIALQLAKLARRRLSYDYTSLLIYEALDSIPADDEVEDEKATEALFAAYDKFVDGLDAAGRRSLEILKCYLLLDLADLRPQTLTPEKRTALELRLTNFRTASAERALDIV